MQSCFQGGGAAAGYSIAPDDLWLSLVQLEGRAIPRFLSQFGFRHVEQPFRLQLLALLAVTRRCSHHPVPASADAWHPGWWPRLRALPGLPFLQFHHVRNIAFRRRPGTNKAFFCSRCESYILIHLKLFKPGSFVMESLQIVEIPSVSCLPPHLGHVRATSIPWPLNSNW